MFQGDPSMLSRPSFQYLATAQFLTLKFLKSPQFSLLSAPWMHLWMTRWCRPATPKGSSTVFFLETRTWLGNNWAVLAMWRKKHIFLNINKFVVILMSINLANTLQKCLKNVNWNFVTHQAYAQYHQSVVWLAGWHFMPLMPHIKIDTLVISGRNQPKTSMFLGTKPRKEQKSPPGEVSQGSWEVLDQFGKLGNGWGSSSAHLNIAPKWVKCLKNGDNSGFLRSQEKLWWGWAFQKFHF